METTLRDDDDVSKKNNKSNEEEAKKLNIEYNNNNNNNTSGPWWRIADGEELASFVSQKSLIENCDLPHPPQSSTSRFLLQGHPRNFPFSTRLLPHSSERLTKGELLEALCRCQTRAREAEKLASEYYAEKELILKLFFQQASHLFAYKQWIQLLQLQQNKINVDSSNNKNKKKNPAAATARRKRIKKVRAFAYLSKLGDGFAAAFGLIGAGLLLGWTIGWIFP